MRNPVRGRRLPSATVVLGGSVVAAVTLWGHLHRSEPEPIKLAGYHIYTANEKASADVEKSVKANGDLFARAEGYKVTDSRGGLVGGLVLYRLTAKAQGSGDDLPASDATAEAASGGTTTKLHVGAVTVYKVTGVGGRQLDLYEWVTGDTLSMVYGIDRAAAGPFLRSYLEVFHSHAPSG